MVRYSLLHALVSRWGGGDVGHVFCADCGEVFRIAAFAGAGTAENELNHLKMHQLVTSIFTAAIFENNKEKQTAHS